MHLLWAVMTRTAVPGQVKTRLATIYGPMGALLVHRWLVRRTLRIVETMPGDRMLWIHPANPDLWTQRQARRGGWVLRAQQGEDLGARMDYAVRLGLERYEAVILLGTDLPTLAPDDLRMIVQSLDEGAEIVFLPAYDGGYGALGLSRHVPALFRGIPWGKETVLRDSRLRLRGCGRRIRLLAPLPDCDRPEDLRLLRQRLPAPLLRRLTEDSDGRTTRDGTSSASYPDKGSER